MWGRIDPHAVLLIFANIILRVSSKGSLTFLIDDTGSMSDDIRQVRSSVNRISNVVFNEKSSLISNMVLVTFNDPDAQVRTVTNNRNTFKRTLNAVYAHNVYNYDCWEPSMNGLLLALDKSNSDSYIYVFTDAPAKDYRDARYVKEMCQKKQSQIVFVLTGRCSDYYEAQAFDVYFDIAHACSGLAFDVSKTDVEAVLRTIEETIKGNKTVITSTIVAAGVKKDIPFTIDDQTDYAIVSVSGRNVYLEISGPSANLERIMWNNNGKVVKLSNAKPGKYVATVKGQTRTSVVIVGRTDFFFSHGFSKLKPKSRGDTSLQPIADANVHLSISVTDEHHSVKIVSAQILDMNENPMISPVPLTEISKDFYVTPPFVAPSQRFKIAVNGIVKVTGKPIKRIAKIPITPSEPPKVLPTNTKPTVEIAEGKAIEIEYNSAVKLTCKVVAFPAPKITWVNNNGDVMPSKMSLQEYPYKYISYMDISHASKGDRYKCYAVNNVGSDETTINVVVKEPFTVKSVPSGATKLTYGKEGTIACDVTSRLPMDIHWHYANKVTGQTRKIETSDKYEISASRTQLKIKKMDLDLVGRYTCKVSLKNNKAVEKSFTTVVKINGLIAPKIQGRTEIKITKGKTAILECKVASGVPAPKITWLFGGKTGSKFTALAGSESVLRITNVEDKHEGKYKCLAENRAGKDELVTTLFVQDLPKITTKTSVVYQATDGDALLRIPCVATGVPKPVIVWKLNGRYVTPSAKYSIEDGTLIIRNPKVSDTNSYTCEAKNEAGVVSATFKTYIRRAPRVSGVTAKKVRLGMPANIDCTVEGEPKPTIKWQFMDHSSSKMLPIPGSDKVLNLPRVEKKHAGSYKCVAQNEIGSDEHVTMLIVEFAPEITKKPTTVEGKEGDLALRIPCDVVGNPKPVITWKLKGATITPGAKYSIKDGTLIINNPKSSDTNSYTCEAKNEAGVVSATFKTYIRRAPRVSGVTAKKVRLGMPANIDCTVEGEPKPTIKWQFMDHSSSKMLPIPGSDKVLNLPRVEKKHAGSYKCVAQNEIGSDEHVTMLIVEFAPEITKKPTTVEGKEGDLALRIPCDVVGNPKPVITWKLKGATITPGAKYSIKDGTLIINNPKSSDTNSYTCEAKNEAGVVSATFKTYIRRAPRVSGVTAKKVRLGMPANIDCTVEGEPKPTIKWQFMDHSSSKMLPIPGSDKVLNLPRVEKKHAGSYKCVAQNEIGSDEHVTMLIVEFAPEITKKPTTVEGKEGDLALRIPCDVVGNPKPVITWKLKGATITPGAKYSIKDGTLIINNPKSSDTNSYTCEAKNEAGVVSATFNTYIRQAPRVSGVTAMKVRLGKPASIECTVEGEPKPTIKWQFMDKSSSKMLPIPGSNKVLHFPMVENKHAGSYKCVAQNELGSDEHVTTFIVEFAPEIMTNSTTVEGIEGDLALRIPCDVVGNPKPVITWKLKGATITPDSKYSIEDGALVIMKPTEKDSSVYTCDAKNYISTVSTKFQVTVEKLPTNFGTEHFVYLLQGETEKLKCDAYSSASQSVQWFITKARPRASDSLSTTSSPDLESTESTAASSKDYSSTPRPIILPQTKNANITEPYIQIANASYTDHDGNYTCRVSDKNGNTYTHTYIVDVGSAPEFHYRVNPLNNWRGVISHITQNCDIQDGAKPKPVVEWTLNGKVLTDLNLAGEGHYTCNVSNVHKSVQRSFDVKSSACLISRNLKNANMPLILDDRGFWHKFKNTDHYAIVEQEAKITLSCPSEKEANTFKNFPRKSKLEAFCYKGDSFLVESKLYKLSDLQCTQSIQPSVIRKKVKCSSETSELMRVGYNVPGFLEAYEVCFDTEKNMPLYTRVVMTETNNNGLSAGYNWHTHPGIGIKNTERGFTCKDKMSSCCYSKSQLVNAIDFNDGPAKKSSFIDPLNVVPVWLPCDTSKPSWEKINDMVRVELPRYTDLVTWSGTHTLQEKNGAIIPRYLWKVVRLDDDEAVAIVHVNDPKPIEKDIKCKKQDICDKYDDWFTSNDKYTYCCTLPEFFESFDIHGTDIGESIDAVLDKIENST